MPLKLLNWNVEWAEPKWKAAELQRRIGQHAADIICLTETDTARLKLPEGGHSICAQDNWGQPFQRVRRADGRSCCGPERPGSQWLMLAMHRSRPGDLFPASPRPVLAR